MPSSESKLPVMIVTRGMALDECGRRQVTGRAASGKFYIVGIRTFTLRQFRLMTLDEYQTLAARTMGVRTQADQLSNMALGLAGEAGETADMLKKHLFHGKPLDADDVIKELGDVMWYVAGMATAIGVSLDEIAQRNVDKLRKRYPDGFSVEASARRADVVA